MIHAGPNTRALLKNSGTDFTHLSTFIFVRTRAIIFSSDSGRCISP
jgi:hypothetical protein